MEVPWLERLCGRLRRLNRRFKTPTRLPVHQHCASQWNVDIQREFDGGLLLDIGYTGGKGRPEETVKGLQRRPGSFSFEASDLLPEGEDFDANVASITQTRTNYRQNREQDSATKQLF